MLGAVFERFTESARAVVIKGQEAARELGHAHIGTEHELLGLLANSDSAASGVLHSLGITAAEARARVLEIVPPGDQHLDGQIAFTPRAKRVLELSLREALSLGHRNITPEHLLLGLTHAPDGVAMQVLVGLGVEGPAIRDAVLPFLPPREDEAPREIRGAYSRVPRMSPAPVLRRALDAAGQRAAGVGRTEFGLDDLLAAIAEDEDAATVVASLGLDLRALRQASEDDAGSED
jgi:ATP-dependent Clp protease ATP-binding subunit ClpC